MWNQSRIREDNSLARKQTLCLCTFTYSHYELMLIARVRTWTCTHMS